MRINPIGTNYQLNSRLAKTAVITSKPASFQGRHDTAKALGGLFGIMGTLGAITGTIIMSGGVALPFVIGYGALSAGSGAIVGHVIDKSNPDYNKNK